MKASRSIVNSRSGKILERFYGGTRTGPPEKIEHIITGSEAPAELVRKFRENGTTVYQVD